MLVLLTAACDPTDGNDRADGTTTPPPPSGGHITFGVLGAPPTLDPSNDRASDLTYFLGRLVDRSPGRPARKRPRPPGSGPFVVDQYVPGLKISYVPDPEWDGDPPRVDRLTVQFIASLEIMLQLLANGRLDAAAVPSAVNIDERLDELGLNYASVLGREVISLNLEETPDRQLRAAIVAAIGVDVIEEGLIRDEGKLIGVGPHNAIGAAPGTEIQLGTAAGDELLTMMQRLLQKQLEPNIRSELVTTDPATFYGAWESDSPLDVALRREIVPGSHRPRVRRDLSWIPLFSVESFLAWNDGVVGLEPKGTLDGPFWNAELWALE